jgi:hypothetical protein
LVRSTVENRRDLDAVSSTARRPLGDDGARLDEELGPEKGEGKLMCPQSASSPRVEFGCLVVRRVRSSRVPRSNEISSLTLRAFR